MVRHTKKKPRNGATRQGSFAYQTLEPRQLLAADVIITEFLASNDTVLADDNGNFSDYIELYNAGDETADLTGFSLTDDPNQPDKFTFSAGTLAAGEYLVVFAADDTNPTTGTDIYTGFGLSAGGEFVGLYDAAGSLRSSFGENGTDFPPQTTDVTYGLAFEPLPIVIPDILLGSGSGQGNGSFEDITGGTPNFGSNRIGTNGNNGFTASIPGWTVTHQSGGLVGWDDLSPASDGSEYGFVNANAQAVFVSDARFHNLSAGDTLDLSFDTINNVVGESVIFRVTLLFSNGDSAFFQRTHTETDGSYSVEAFRHTVTENQANSSSLSVRIELDNRFNTQQDQPRFDNVQLIRTDASFVPTVLEDFDTVVAPALPAGWVSSTNSTNNFQTGATFADAGVNGVSVAGVEGSSNATLTSPPITVTARNATIRFRHAYQIESGFDGAVLELAIGNGQFQDIIDSGGAFRQGGYDRVLISSQLAGREGWSGTSGGFGTTIVELPTTSHGSDVRLRWRFSSDASVRSGNWSIDTIEQIELIDNSGGADLPREPRTGVFLATPTPGMRNSDRRIGGVTFSQSSQIFLTPFALTLTSAIPNETIRFTLDGSVPTQSSTLYTGPISISVSTEVRARAYSLDGLAGAVFGETYELLTAGLNSFTSNLPILVLDNYGAGNPLTRTFNTTFTALYEPDATTGLTSLTSSATLTSRAATHRRGSSSFTLGKNNFRLEFRDQTDEDQNVSILGMPSESDYILNTFARFDRAAVRNPVAFDTNRQAGVYAPRYRYVEVFFNQDGDALEESDYFGVYLIQENIKRDNDRVDIAKLEPTDDTPTLDLLGDDPITGGYIVKGDRNQSGEPAFDTSRGNPSTERFVVDEPSTLTSNQFSYIRNYFQATENAIFGPGFKDSQGRGYEQFIDVDSFIDQHIFQAFWKGPDALRFSTYFHKDRGGKLKAGPNWDQERIAGVESDTNINRARNPENWYGDGSVTDIFEHDWWDRLFDDPNFQQRWVDRFEELRVSVYNTASFDALYDGYEAQLLGANPLDSPVTRNFLRWGASASTGSSGSANNGREAWPNARIPTSTDPSSNDFYQFADPSFTAGVPDPQSQSTPTAASVLAYWRSELSHVRNWTNLRLDWIYSQFSETAGFNVTSGLISAGTDVNLTIPASVSGSAQVWYTIDGTDPRDSTDGNRGNPSPGAILWDGNPISIDETMRLTVRILDPTISNPKDQVQSQSNTFDIWSAPSTALFEVGASVAESLAISEINYNPSDPTSAEIASYASATGMTLAEATVALGNDDFEFIEVLNTSTVNSLNLTGTQFTDGVTFTFGNETLAPGERAVVVEDVDAFAARYGTAGIRVLGQWSGGLSSDGERINVLNNLGAEVASIAYNDTDPFTVSADGAGATLVLVDDFNTPQGELGKYYSWRGSVEPGGTPGTASAAPAGVVINEVLTHTDAPLVDSVELFNPTDKAIDLSGYFLSDSGSNPLKYAIPAGTILGAGSYLVFDESDFNPTPLTPGPNDFAFSSSLGDQVYLTRGTAVGGTLLGFEDVVEFGATFNGVSLGRLPNGTGRLTPLANRSLGSVNGTFVVGDLVISEINYHPDAPSAAAIAAFSDIVENDLEFIEIYNRSGSSVDLTDYRLRGEVDFDFPSMMLDSQQNVVVISFDPTDPGNAARTTAFRDHYGISASVVLVGGYGGNLSNSFGRVTLQAPDTPDGVVTPRVAIDEVLYDDLAPWPDADGTGDSLQRLASNSFGNLAASWTADAPTPGAVSLIATAPEVVALVRDEGGVLGRPDLVETLSFTFDTDVNVTVGSLTLLNLTTGGTEVDISNATFSYVAATRTATWDLGNLSSPLPAAFYEVSLPASEISGVGSGFNMVSDFTTELYVALPGDANLDGRVDVLGDGFILVSNLGIDENAVWAQGDFDGDGDVDIIDSGASFGDGFILVRNLGNSVLPANEPLLAANATTGPISSPTERPTPVQAKSQTRRTDEPVFAAATVPPVPAMTFVASPPPIYTAPSKVEQNEQARQQQIRPDISKPSSASSDLAGALSIDRAFGDWPLDGQTTSIEVAVATEGSGLDAEGLVSDDWQPLDLVVL